MARERDTRKRRKRSSMSGMQTKLTLDSETQKRLKAEGMVARWFNDNDNRIQRAQDSDWEFVTYDGVKVGSKEEGEQDRRIKKSVGRGMTAYLMAIPKEFYEENQREQEERNMLVDEAIRGGQPPGTPPPDVGSAGGTYRGNIQYKP